MLDLKDTDARVLIVDDEPMNVHVLRKLLERTGVTDVEGVTDSTTVMERVRSFEPDIVLLDLHMPAPDGLALLAQIREHAAPSYLPVVVITADVTDAASERALAAGAADFLTKPFAVTETLLRVRNLIHTRRLHLGLARYNTQLAGALAERDAADDDRAERLRAVTAMVEDADAQLAMAFQPVVNLASGAIDGHEALARFRTVPIRPPNEWFADAAEAGVGLQLELAAVRAALASAHLLPADTFVSVNVSSSTLRSPAFGDVITDAPARPVVIELTEHDHIEDYGPVNDVMNGLRRHGARLAVDDTGAGFASLNHILKLRPDFIKLDRLLVTDIDTDVARASLAGALVRFSNETGARLVAEGIETQGELETLTELGVHYGQGFYLGRPEHLAPASVDVENPLGFGPAAA